MPLSSHWRPARTPNPPVPAAERTTRHLCGLCRFRASILSPRRPNLTPPLERPTTASFSLPSTFHSWLWTVRSRPSSSIYLIHPILRLSDSLIRPTTIQNGRRRLLPRRSRHPLPSRQAQQLGQRELWCGPRLLHRLRRRCRPDRPFHLQEDPRPQGEEGVSDLNKPQKNDRVTCSSQHGSPAQLGDLPRDAN
ncbi:hypothetical protein VTJ83DRAFT_7339 [Remersonia thermophila]|uniref:Uncharacterized protein n=1 Tax=Remersonia thermophila TaxID=72144 RepID=A0ABR4D488_9PEZI